MVTPSVDEREDRRRAAAYNEAIAKGHLPQGYARNSRNDGRRSATAVAAGALGMQRGTLHSWVSQQRLLRDSGQPCLIGPDPEMPEPEPVAEIPAPEPIEVPPAEARREVRDASFWRARAKALQSELSDVEHALGEMAGIRNQPVTIPEWILPGPSSGKKRSVVGALLSDIHMGEVIDGDEILNLNAYDDQIARRRVRRYFTALCEVGTRWSDDCDNHGVLLALAGDMISGDIHEELMRTNCLTSHEQVLAVVEEVGAGIRHLLEAFGRVHVVSVPGNHGRTTHKPTAKLYSRLSYDTLVATMLAGQFAADERVTFQITPSPDAIVPILGRTVFITHGDKMGTGGGQGFAGPILPIVRGTKKVEAQQSRANRRPDVIMHGHYHTSANPGDVFSNGSVPGYSEFGNAIRASVEPPQQWMMLFHSTWGVRERLPVQLETTTVRELPRVRVPASMRRA